MLSKVTLISACPLRTSRGTSRLSVVHTLALTAQSIAQSLFWQAVTATAPPKNLKKPLSCREPVAESRRPASAAATRRTVATSQQVLVQSYMQQQQVWQKHPLARSVLQRDAARQTLWRLAQMPRLHPNGMFHAHRGLVRQAPLQRSLLSRAGLQRMGFGVLP